MRMVLFPPEKRQMAEKDLPGPVGGENILKGLRNMKKRWILIAVLLCLILTGCRRHRWTEPTCTEKSVCTICGETRGELLPHSWIIASHETPMHCVVCGVTQGERNNANYLVKQACENALETAKNDKSELSRTVLELRDQILPVVDSLNAGVNVESALRALVPEDVSEQEALPLLMDMLSYTEAAEHRRFGAFMRRLSTLEAVSGTISAFEADIAVEDTNQLLAELRIRPNVLGQLMTLLADEATQGLGKLTFTEQGFTFAWKSDGSWVIDLDPEPLPVSEEDLVFYQTASSREERYSDVLKTLHRKFGEETGFVSFYEYLGYEFTGKVRTARGVSIRSPRELVLSLYGPGIEIAVGENSDLYASMFPGGTGDKTQREDFLRQSRTAMEYPVTEKVSLVFTFDENNCVAWLIVLQK